MLVNAEPLTDVEGVRVDLRIERDQVVQRGVEALGDDA